MFPGVDFVGNWRRWFAISGVLLALGLLAIAIGRLDLGIDFQGGAQFTATGAERQLDEDEVTAALPPGIAEESVVTTLGGDGYEVRTPVLSEAESEEVESALSEALGAEVSATSVSPAFGEQVRNQALQAVAAALLIIVAFISVRFEFSFAIAAMAALVHDVLLTIGFYAVFEREVSLVTVVAVLTVLGYSLYDTIIIFDRIRENSPTVGYNRRRFDEMINTSIRQVVRRSIYTSIFTLIPITALLIFGESTLSDFAFALLVGILAGAYSSIFIAPQVLSLYKAWRAGSVQRSPRSA
ncbi:MAG: Protein translocase subunit SecF [uncultured Rubrobacteraceae bacterium]|uniref:Protein-export membrane protein SecF n=1 Tax=uncultured Rubrobacteraceae bacterium TaxID=349277 RepID=A0A6J4RK46_9ACTN|nr:MAG: Protein translocase subunit SecF [uncultured Rubrobacteraceae bacterium]